MGQSYTAREQNKEAVKEQTQTLRHLVHNSLTLHVAIIGTLVFAPFQAFLGLNRVNDVRDYSAAHGHWNTLVLAHRWLFTASNTATLPRIRLYVLSVTDNGSSDLLLRLKVLQATLVKGIPHLVHERTMTVTLCILCDTTSSMDSVLLLLGDLMLRTDLILLRADMLRLDHSKLLLHLAALLGDYIWGLHVFGSTGVQILKS